MKKVQHLRELHLNQNFSRHNINQRIARRFFRENTSSYTAVIAHFTTLLNNFLSFLSYYLLNVFFNGFTVFLTYLLNKRLSCKTTTKKKRVKYNIGCSSITHKHTHHKMIQKNRSMPLLILDWTLVILYYLASKKKTSEASKTS